MYLFIFEDGSINATRVVVDEDKSASDDGILDIIDIGDPGAPKQYVNSEWVDIDLLDT